MEKYYTVMLGKGYYLNYDRENTPWPPRVAMRDLILDDVMKLPTKQGDIAMLKALANMRRVYW